MSTNLPSVPPKGGAKTLHPVWIWGLTIAIVFHLMVLLITPNSENYFGYRLRPWFQPYVSLFEFSGDWKFFSPDPAPKLVLEWSVMDRSGNLIQVGNYPGFESPFIIADRELRRVASLKFMLMGANLKNMWVPYLCRLYPRAFSVRLNRIFLNPPLLGEIVDQKRSVTDEGAQEQTDLGMEFCES